MPHVSRHHLDKKREKELIRALEVSLARTGGEKMALLLNSLLTPTEKLMLAKRLAAAILLKEKVSESDIARTLNMTRATVDKLSLQVEMNGKGYDAAITALEKEKLTKDFKKMLVKVAQYSVRAAGGYVKPSVV